MSKKAELAAEQLELTAYIVGKLIAERLGDALSSAFEATGYWPNFSNITSRELGDAMVALAGVACADDRCDIVHACVFYYELHSKNGVRDWAKADAIADYTKLEPRLLYSERHKAKRRAA